MSAFSGVYECAHNDDYVKSGILFERYNPQLGLLTLLSSLLYTLIHAYRLHYCQAGAQTACADIQISPVCFERPARDIHAMQKTQPQPPVRRVGFILFPGFALTSFSLAVEALSVSNLLLGYTAYDYRLYSGDSDPKTNEVLTSNHVPNRTTFDMSLFLLQMLKAQNYRAARQRKRRVGVTDWYPKITNQGWIKPFSAISDRSHATKTSTVGGISSRWGYRIETRLAGTGQFCITRTSAPESRCA